MGRKGVSKRKSPKSKDSKVSGQSTNAPVPIQAGATDRTMPQPANGGKSTSTGKGGKKK